MIKTFPKANFYDKKFSEVLKEAEKEDGIILGAFQIVRFETGKWYAIEDINGEKRILQYDSSGVFTMKDNRYPGNVKIAKVFWESTEEELFSETFSPHPETKQSDDYWVCYKHNLDARSPEDHNLHEANCRHFDKT
jgi:hypothetical protein